MAIFLSYFAFCHGFSFDLCVWLSHYCLLPLFNWFNNFQISRSKTVSMVWYTCILFIIFSVFSYNDIIGLFDFFILTLVILNETEKGADRDHVHVLVSEYSSVVVLISLTVSVLLHVMCILRINVSSGTIAAKYLKIQSKLYLHLENLL